MQRFLYSGCFLLALIYFFITQIPLGWVLEKSNIRASGLDWATARGTAIKGDVIGLDYRRSVGPVIALGAAEMTLRPLSLLTGNIHYTLNWAAHSGYATGDISVNAGQTLNLTQTNANLRIDQLEGLETALRLSGTTLRINVEKVIWHIDTGCRAAQGEVNSNWVQILGAEFGQTWSDLRGTLTCDGANLKIEMQSTSQFDESITLGITLFPAGLVDVKIQLDNLEESTSLLAKSALENLEPTETGFEFTYRVGR